VKLHAAFTAPYFTGIGVRKSQRAAIPPRRSGSCGLNIAEARCTRILDFRVGVE
jgi:hypothetical protein